jgi:hypothetical protein
MLEEYSAISRKLFYRLHVLNLYNHLGQLKTKHNLSLALSLFRKMTLWESQRQRGRGDIPGSPTGISEASLKPEFRKDCRVHQKTNFENVFVNMHSAKQSGMKLTQKVLAILHFITSFSNYSI